MANKGNSIKQKRMSYNGRSRILRKEYTWTYTTRPGTHNKSSSSALGLIIRDVLSLADNTREVKYILNNKNVLVNGKVCKDYGLGIGIFDVVEFTELGKKFRVFFDEKGFIKLKEMAKDDLYVRPSKVVNKVSVGLNKFQYTVDFGFTFLSDKAYSVRDTLVFDLKSMKVLEVIPFKVGSSAYIVSGPHVGFSGVISDIVSGDLGKSQGIIVKNKEHDYRTISDYAFAVPKGFA